jgi:thioredoxin reductase
LPKRQGRGPALRIHARGPGRLSGTGETFDIPADMIFKAIGQSYVDVLGGKLELEGGRIKVDTLKRTSVPASGPAATVWRAART